ncbi:Uncharacterised protein [Moraxella lacunata]|uniref:Uncharacterized protein n=1 Tax=Moraxella lacunata TaxID=477 RepID=A0A1V4GV41_MORLA|nr:hypothetical protein [Moraxella lacunata]OPH36492.1 hypothetical protein B5J94_07110 [Moraxella lacunata]STY99063.1 Uncharacterised protein [Moraxella lacunata]
MKLHGFISVTTNCNQEAVVNISQISSIVAKYRSGEAVITLNNGESYELYCSVSEVKKLIKEEQNQ